MRRVRSLFLPSLVLAALLLPTSWTAIDQVQASSGGIPPFKGVVIKCVGFNLWSNMIAITHGPSPLLHRR
jgi:hypothetical protein